MELLDEIGDRLQAGEPVDVEAYVQAHPQYTERLQELLPAIRAIAQFAASGDASVPPTGADSKPTAERLGDFRIVREIGRGGMGIVYEAEQVSLGRRVALRILPFAATMDPRQLQRFKNEAHAAAQLHHTNIVPVYAVGCERAVHYYAMQFIEGLTLADVIAELRGEAKGPATKAPLSLSPHPDATVDAPAGQRIDPPSPARTIPQTKTIAGLSTARSTKDPACFRTIAELGIQAAEALDYAHQQGIVHRDIKPANLLVDANGRLWITDFGLAQVQSDTRLTMTGDLVGTLRYMSPEQALAQRAVVDHRTDVYSLGATFYELLTLKPVFTGRNRQQLLQQIAFDDPRRPRQYNSAIPSELEIVVLKALEKNPEDRYATAQDLADDLQHWLDDRPIRARRPTLLARLSKWARRHKRVIGAGAGGLVIAVVALGVSVALAAAAYRSEANLRHHAEEQEQVAEGAKVKAEQERDSAEHHLYLARIHLAHSALLQNDLTRTEELLEQSVPKSGRPDFRGWEWSYLKALCHRELRSFGCDQYLIDAVIWSPKGKHVFTTGRIPGSRDRVAKVWDAVGGNEILSIRGADGAPMAWSPDGRSLAIGGQIRDGATGKLIVRLPEANEKAVWSPDGRNLAYAGANSIRIWSVATGKRLLDLRCADDQLVWSPQGGYLAAMGHAVTIWHVGTGKQVLAARVDARLPSSALAWSAQEQYVAFSDRANVQVYDLASARPQLTQPCYAGGIHPVCWSPDGERLAVADAYAYSGPKEGAAPESVDDPGVVRIWNIRSGKESRPLHGHRKGICSLAWCPDGMRLASASFDGSLKVWNTFGGNEILTHRHGWGGGTQVCWSPDAMRMALQMRGMVRLWDGATDSNAIVLRGTGFYPCSLAWRPDSQRLASAGATVTQDGQIIEIWDPSTGENLRTAKEPSLHRESALLSWSPDGKWLAHRQMKTLKQGIALPEAVVVRRADTAKEEWILSGYTSALAWGEGGDRLTLLVDGDQQTSLASYDLTRQRELARWKLVASARDPEWMTYAPSGARVALASVSEGLVKIWDTATGEQLATIRVGLFEGSNLAWSPDGSQVAAADIHSPSIRVWDAATATPIAVLRGQNAHPVRLAWTPDGQRLLSADVRGTLRLWDITAGQEALVLQSPEADCRTVAWSPDGQTLATGHWGGTIRIWDATPRRGLMLGQRVLAEASQQPRDTDVGMASPVRRQGME
jgi:WD40 repeat protein/serine/threonine protein kinase